MTALPDQVEPIQARAAQDNSLATQGAHAAWSPDAPIIQTRAVTGDRHLPPLFLSGNDHEALKAGDHPISLTVDGRERQVEIHVPPGYDGSKPIPVMYLMPGMGGSIAQMKNETGMNRRADQNGFAVVYVQALAKEFPGTLGLEHSPSWNLDHGSLTDKTAGYDDLNYIKAADRLVDSSLNVDKNAKYIAGFSEGGGAAQFIAESMPHTFAGVGSVHGTHLDSDLLPYKDDPTAFIAIHGDNDHMLPLSGGRGFMTVLVSRAAQSEPAVQPGIWARAEGDSQVSISDDGKDKITTYSGGSAPVEMIIRHGGEHAWDGLGQNPKDGKPTYGWYVVGEPDATESSSTDLVKGLMSFRKDGSHADPNRNFLTGDEVVVH
ncbi:MAG TPA: PHB depolymerase family esterase [Chroococcales cyanobacterium]